MDIDKKIKENVEKMHYYTFSIFNNDKSNLHNLLYCVKLYVYNRLYFKIVR